MQCQNRLYVPGFLFLVFSRRVISNKVSSILKSGCKAFNKEKDSGKIAPHIADVLAMCACSPEFQSCPGFPEDGCSVPGYVQSRLYGALKKSGLVEGLGASWSLGLFQPKPF